MRIKLLVLICFIVLVGFLGIMKIRSYLAIDKVDSSITQNVSSVDSIIPTTATPVNYKLEVFAGGLFVPWSIVFTSPERMLVTERNGAIRVVQNGELVKEPLIEFPEVSGKGEEGLMGLTKDPSYDQNKFLYTSLAYPVDKGFKVKILKLIDGETKITIDTVLLDNIPAATNHAGSRILFGPDGKLYITTGDATDRDIAQNLNSLGGKVLRMNADGSVPLDNPFPNSYVYSLGHRNPQGIAWHPVTNELFLTEHGPSGFDGPGGGDEVNVIKASQNYGWPIVHHKEHQDGLVDPLLEFTPAIAPGAGMFYSGDIFPQLKNNFLFALLKGTGIMRVELSVENSSKVERVSKLPDINVGRIREVTEGPDGFIYFTTSNRDGRGKTNSGDDHIYRLVPE